MSTDRIIFEYPDGRKAGAPWPGSWPPPEKILVRRLADQGRMLILDLPTFPDLPMESMQHAMGAELWVRQSASEILEPAGEDEHWFRGALYKRPIDGAVLDA